MNKTIINQMIEASVGLGMQKELCDLTDKNIFIDLTELLYNIVDRNICIAVKKGSLTELFFQLDIFINQLQKQDPKSITLVQDGSSAQPVAMYLFPQQLTRQNSLLSFQKTGNNKFIEDSFELNMRQKLLLEKHINTEFSSINTFIAPILARNSVTGYDIVVSQQQWALLQNTDVIPNFYSFFLCLQGQTQKYNYYTNTFINQVLGDNKESILLILGDEFFPGFQKIRQVENSHQKYQKVTKIDYKLEEYDFQEAYNMTKNMSINGITSIMLNSQEALSQMYFQDYSKILTPIEILMNILERQFVKFYYPKFNIATKETVSPIITAADQTFCNQFFCSYFKQYSGNKENTVSIIEDNEYIFTQINHLLLNQKKQLKLNKFQQLKTKIPLNFEEFSYFYEITVRPRSGSKAFLAEMRDKKHDVMRYIQFEPVIYEDDGARFKRVLRR